MPRRLHQTLADYLVIAISPALIMALVGSLMFFLLRVFYQGQFQERLHWVMACFVFAAVLIGRISIEEGFERAAPFGAALGLLVGIAANRFMEYQGTWVDHYGWIVNFTVIGIVWWCAHQLTWDCTVIDDAEDSSGEGLLQIVGLDRAGDARNSQVDQQRLEGTTSREVPAGFWQRYVEHQRRPHAPGVWVVYFSLAALPIFGLGQWLIPASDVAGRRYVFWLLCVYVASGLGLLLTTSFLGLRRYLRQRRIEMPSRMANLWLFTGAAIVASLLLVTALLPRPSAEYAISQLPFTLGSPEQDSSHQAPMRREGTKDEQVGPAADRQPGESASPDSQASGSGHEPTGESSASDQTEPDAKGSAAERGDSGEQQDGSGQQGQADTGQADSRQPSESQRADAQHPRQSQSEQAAPSPETAGDEDDPSRPTESQLLLNSGEQQPSANALAAVEEDPSPTEPEAESSQEAEGDGSQALELPSIEPLSPLMTLLKYVVYVLLAIGVLAALWIYRAEVLEAVRGFLAELRAWWAALWGGDKLTHSGDDVIVDVRIPPPPFASFADPFATGAAAGYSGVQLVRYSFEAFEAWSREHGCERGPEQTPHELARDVGRLNAFIASDARILAELYARAAFARGDLPSDTHTHLQKLWSQMRHRQQVLS